MEPNKRRKIQATTQAHLQVLEIVDDLVITKTGSVVLVIQTTAVNFDLLSEYEQDNKIMAFSGLLNSLNFHIQILIRTKRIDISNYITYLKSQLNNSMSPGLKKQLEVYTTFINNLIVQNDVLDKKFYVVIPYSGIDMSTPIEMLVGSGKQEEIKVNSYQMQKKIEQGKIFLYPKRDHILKQLSRMSLAGHQLKTDELVELFYDMYNEEQ